MKSFFLRVAGLLALFTCFGSYAGVVTIGNLTTDSNGDTITDTVSGRLYTRFDAFSLSYNNTLSAISSGAYQGWSVASAEVADDFVSAALGGTSSHCDGAVSYGTFCGVASGWRDGALGASYSGYHDYFAYMTAAGTRPISLVEFRYNGQIRDYENWSSPHRLDRYANINLLLYKEAAAVPEPTTLALFTLGILGLAFARRKKR